MFSYWTGSKLMHISSKTYTDIVRLHDKAKLQDMHNVLESMTAALVILLSTRSGKGLGAGMSKKSKKRSALTYKLPILSSPAKTPRCRFMMLLLLRNLKTRKTKRDLTIQTQKMV